MKKYGDEHFMVDDGMLEKICKYASLTRKDYVLEVGAGTGNLTKKLAESAGRVFAIEKNQEFFEKLNSELGRCDNVELAHGDATKIAFPECNKIVSNLPYSISRRITKKFITHGFDSAVLVYQKEFAEKLTAQVESEHYRMISALVQSTCEVEVLDKINPDSFLPQPNVWSSIVRLKMKWKPPEEYEKLLNTVFNHKNKKLRNTLENPPEKYADCKPAQMTPEELVDFYKSYI
ncbi:MAG: 16S rRNA (adenine(1518)-N(6)/adenine(1519)-N(6))-dimethyltransferase RsmA [Candidatus Altiarchaeota archaeon]|nr:16S rRNA (adenine(1518)-N(6)/adenine(1519)-N(6))-dimethyltransferase RsmA [Candidatus Altiarchaeota archaeon]